MAVETAPVEATEQKVGVEGVDRGALAALREEGGPAIKPELLSPETKVDTFDLVGVTWPEVVGERTEDVQVQVRVRESGGWTEWEALDVEDGGPTPGSEEYERSRKIVATEPLLTLGADAVQVRLDSPDGQAPSGVELALVDGGQGAALAGREALDADPSASASASVMASASTSSTRPTIISRAQWGADESMARTASQNRTVTAMTIHHTASSNAYTSAAGAMAQLRSIYSYHTKTQGWSDIGYNFVVDKFGNIYEGRRGSITSNPVGAHASGFNTSTMGISALGNYEAARPSSAMVESISKVVAWRLGGQGLDVTGRTTLTSAGGSSRFRKGTQATLPRVFGHGDVGYTACPGVYLNGQLSTIRAKAAAYVKSTSAPAPPPAPAPAPPAPAPVPVPVGVPLVGDWDGSGGAQLGWYRDGWVSLRMGPQQTVSYRYGRAGDVPVVGDW
ncbi:peptidoglycan recognition protein family protein, partial [Pseudokineococcus sp. 1T1Z-3]|uniref:peptidoglycan recognition protein family protein n=1 Tax=Pseudokineococcus sp. 1T1Z-3 TaxID=3132745 RepID=UPI0030B76273